MLDGSLRLAAFYRDPEASGLAFAHKKSVGVFRKSLPPFFYFFLPTIRLVEHPINPRQRPKSFMRLVSEFDATESTKKGPVYPHAR